MSFGNVVGTASTYIDENTADAILKEVYSDKEIENEIFVDNPFLALVPKNENVPGRFYNVPVVANAGANGSRVFTQAQLAGGISGEGFFGFQAQKFENHISATVSSQAIAESSSSKGAFIDVVKAIADDQLHAMTNDTAISFYRK